MLQIQKFEFGFSRVLSRVRLFYRVALGRLIQRNRIYLFIYIYSYIYIERDFKKLAHTVKKAEKPDINTFRLGTQRRADVANSRPKAVCRQNSLFLWGCHQHWFLFPSYWSLSSSISKSVLVNRSPGPQRLYPSISASMFVHRDASLFGRERG